VLELIKTQGQATVAPLPDAYAVIPDASAMAVTLQTLQTLRAAGISVQMHASGAPGLGSMKSQLKKADSSGARYALIFGADELAQNLVTVKALRDGQGAQVIQSLADVASWASTLQSHA
jgi:histidyl-tRNA synthetase